MDATSSFVSFPKPIYWDEIIAYAKLNRSTGNTEKLLPVLTLSGTLPRSAARPPATDQVPTIHVNVDTSQR